VNESLNIKFFDPITSIYTGYVAMSHINPSLAYSTINQNQKNKFNLT